MVGGDDEQEVRILKQRAKHAAEALVESLDDRLFGQRVAAVAGLVGRLGVNVDEVVAVQGLPGAGEAFGEVCSRVSAIPDGQGVEAEKGGKAPVDDARSDGEAAQPVLLPEGGDWFQAAGPLGHQPLDGEHPPALPLPVDRMLPQLPVDPGQVGLERGRGPARCGVLGVFPPGAQRRQRTSFPDRVAIGDEGRNLALHHQDPEQPLGLLQADGDAFDLELPDRRKQGFCFFGRGGRFSLVENQAAFGFMDPGKMRQDGHVGGVQGNARAQGLQRSPAGEFRRVEPEHGKVGIFAGQGLAHGTGMVEAIGPLTGQPVEMRGSGRLQGSLPVERLDGSISQAVEKYQETFVGQRTSCGWGRMVRL